MSSIHYIHTQTHDTHTLSVCEWMYIKHRHTSAYGNALVRGGGGGVDCPKFYTDNRRGYRISWRGGGGGEDIHKHPPPLRHCPRDVIRPPENWKTPPLLDIHKHLPLGHCPRDVIRPPENNYWKTPPLLDIHKHLPLGHCPRDVIRPPENWKTPPLLDIHKHPLDIVRVTSSARPPENWKTPPPPTIAASQKKDRRCPKNWVAQKLGGGGCSPPPSPPGPYAYARRHTTHLSKCWFKGCPTNTTICLLGQGHVFN